MSRLDFVTNRKEVFVDIIKTICKHCNANTFYGFYKKVMIEDINAKDCIKVKQCRCGNNIFDYEFVIKKQNVKIVKGWVNKKGKVVKRKPEQAIRSYMRRPPELSIFRIGEDDKNDGYEGF